MIEEFKKYVSIYDLTNPKIRLKYDHSFRVMKLNKEYASKLDFSYDDILLAELIGLLHDIGRFEQLKIYDTYNDQKSIDHADYSVEQLFDKNLIKKFTGNIKDYEIIKEAIKNHNKYEISNIDNEQIVKHCKLIRDTDKIDILYNFAYLGLIDIEDTNDPISELVISDILSHKTVFGSHKNNQNDLICSFMAFAFDINYDIFIPIVKEYLEVIYKRIEHKKIFEDSYNEIIRYIEKRMK